MSFASPITSISGPLEGPSDILGREQPPVAPDRLGAVRPQARSASPIRRGLIARVRAQIAEGSYETPDRFNKAVGVLARTLR